jgi:hypothetical protein
MGRLTIDDGVPTAREITVRRTLELDHIRTEVGKMTRAQWSRHRLLQRHDPHT